MQSYMYVNIYTYISVHTVMNKIVENDELKSIVQIGRINDLENCKTHKGDMYSENVYKLNTSHLFFFFFLNKNKMFKKYFL
ncbi:hypothetical protein PUN28_011542 [Cardiocondyla obscurior]|uniref:Uncharacterized protein n=1 Tax=Cardiocondyla obscurior TaxID=286306 RepID=A0AAW2FJK7_9HYME